MATFIDVQSLLAFSAAASLALYAALSLRQRRGARRRTRP